jgi:hypothetical protein
MGTSRHILQALAAQLGHTSSMTEHYLNMSGIGQQQNTVREQHNASAQRRRALIARLSGPEFIAETGKCKVGAPQCRVDSDCLTASFPPWDSSAHDVPKNMSSSAPQAAHGLLREWHDLDRTDALTVHLSALDQQLRS